MEIIKITEKEFLNILQEQNDIPIWSSEIALYAYQEKELIKVVNHNQVLAIFLIPLDNKGVRRKYRFFPYISPVLIENRDTLQEKNINKMIFHYLFSKYDYTFIPLSPNYKAISAIASQGGFVEIRHTHVVRKALKMEELNPKLRNHIRSAEKKLVLKVDKDSKTFDFQRAIKGKDEEQKERSIITKKIINNNQGFYVKAYLNQEIVAGITIVFDKEWAYLLHSYQKEKIRGAVPYMILKAMEIAFEEKKVKYFDFEGSVIDDIDDFFASFNAEIITYPYVIYAKKEKDFFNLINRSIQIEGRIKEIDERNSNGN